MIAYRLEKSQFLLYFCIVRVFKSTWFSRFADKEGITDAELKETINLLENEQADANLGGGVFKVRLARAGEGKSGAYRVIIFFRSGEKTFFHYAYPKARRANIDEGNLRDFKRLAKRYLAMEDSKLTEAVRAREFIEI